MNALLIDQSGNHLIHVAVNYNRCSIVKRILETIFGQGELNAVDSHRNTPLHLAVALGFEDIVQLLLDYKAYVNIKDDSEMTALHVAAYVGNPTILRKLLDNGLDPNIRGESAFTPLHYAAVSNNGNSVSILLEKGADITMTCHNGSTPLHMAAKCGSLDAVLTILREAPMFCAITPLLLLDVKDRENQRPIHSAVGGGNVEVLKQFLKYGADPSCKQDDGLTAVHYAAIQGSLEMLQAMNNLNRKSTLFAADSVDVQGRTPLHWAAIFNHASVTKYLIDLPSDMNAFDSMKLTPLLAAATNSSWAALNVLLSYGADTSLTNSSKRNFLHLAVINGMELNETFKALKYIKNISARCNEKDIAGYTPLHYAAEEGLQLVVKNIISLGASVTHRNRYRQTAFHLAAKFDRPFTCQILLQSANGAVLKNDTDLAGMTALHYAAQEGHLRILNFLIQNGVLVTKDNKDNTPLHLAAMKGHRSCVSRILAVHGYLLDSANNEGNTALHLAASMNHATVVDVLLTAKAAITENMYGLTFLDEVISNCHLAVAEVVINHNRWEECLQRTSKKFGLPILGLIQQLPSVFVHVLDRCVIYSENDEESEEYYEHFNFRYLHLPDSFKDFAMQNKFANTSLLPLKVMMDYKRVDCMAHPLTVTFLWVKWRKYGRIITVCDLVMYSLYLVSLTYFIVTKRSLLHYEKVELGGVSSWDLRNFDDFSTDPNFTDRLASIRVPQRKIWEITDTWFPPEAGRNKFATTDLIVLWMIVFFCGFHLCKEMFQLFQNIKYYFLDMRNILEDATYISSLIFAIPFIFGYSTHLQWECGAIAVFLAWFNCLVQIQRFDYVGIYIIMFLAIMKTLMQVFLIFVILVTAFGLAFYVLMQEEPSKAHSTPFMSLYRTFILTFEIEYLLTVNTVYLDNDPETLHFSHLTFFFLALFLFFMPLLLVNLLIGLAVGDIASVQRDAKQQRLATQVNFHIVVEGIAPFLSQLKDDFKNYPKKTGYSSRGTTRVKTLAREEGQKSEESAIKKEVLSIKSTLDNLFTVCDDNRQIMESIKKAIGSSASDEKMDQAKEQKAINEAFVID
ncbi:transient receptor potential cation channel subfamily A member 1-like [Physella acuta]|uniref:transient receptor potential cation channel subfamily A member 1-like n=1 Tax=Physella acuta TaxID=109671 RepID=UPI0027DE6C49|nr:transient receptor potential cation channel subfamily A member 1-like [Physella acuta]